MDRETNKLDLLWTIQQIFNAALEFNQTENDTEQTPGKPAIFVDLSPHVAQVRVIIYVDGWEANSDRGVERYTIHYGGHEAYDADVDLAAPLKAAETVKSRVYELIKNYNTKMKEEGKG